MKIIIVGAGYVGLTTSACLAELGHTVTCVEKDPGRLAQLLEGGFPFFEPGLPDLVRRGTAAGRLRFAPSTSWRGDGDLIFIAVGTPSADGGHPDMSAVDEVVSAIAASGNGSRPTVVLKSTVPVGTTDRVEEALRQMTGHPWAVACNPEFLREGAAVEDFFHPARIVIGTRAPEAQARLTSLYTPLDSPLLVTTPRNAELIKYASNAFLATKVSFINEIAAICEEVGADVDEVARGMGLDPRIGPHYLRAGIGFGGSCLPKDVRALSALARRSGVIPSVLEAVLEANAARRLRFVRCVEQTLGGVDGKTLAALGLAFKAGTSDVRESPALDILRLLLADGARIRAYDPVAEPAATAVLPELICCPTPYEAVNGVDAVLLLADWPEFREVDWRHIRQRVRAPFVFDGKALGIADEVREAGLDYVVMGQPSGAASPA